MAQPKIYAGVKLRETRARLGLTQKVFAERLGVSLPYLNQMENNNRPVSGGVIGVLAETFGLDVADLPFDTAERTVSDLHAALSDPLFADAVPPLVEIRIAASSAPALGHAFLELYRAYRQTNQQLASMNAVVAQSATRMAITPQDEVRTFIHAYDNYIDILDHAAEQTSRARDVPDALIDGILDSARFQSETSRALARATLVDYFHRAASMPYGPFLRAAHEAKYDLQRLAGIFATSVEHVAHRLSTLRRPGNKGIPFFCVTMDRTGNTASDNLAVQFGAVRANGSCALPSVYQAFETPLSFVRELIETPDGGRYFCIAKDVSQSGDGFESTIKRRTIGFGCDIGHIHDLTYAEGINPRDSSAYYRLT